MDTQASPSFIALLTFFTTEQGGLKAPAVPGDRVKLEFEYNYNTPFAEIEFLDEDTVYAGDSTKAKLIITPPDFDTTLITVGTAFSFTRGDKVIDKGIINEVLNSQY